MRGRRRALGIRLDLQLALGTGRSNFAHQFAQRIPDGRSHLGRRSWFACRSTGSIQRLRRLSDGRGHSSILASESSALVLFGARIQTTARRRWRRDRATARIVGLRFLMVHHAVQVLLRTTTLRAHLLLQHALALRYRWPSGRGSHGRHLL